MLALTLSAKSDHLPWPAHAMIAAECVRWEGLARIPVEPSQHFFILSSLPVLALALSVRTYQSTGLLYPAIPSFLLPTTDSGHEAALRILAPIVFRLQPYEMAVYRDSCIVIYSFASLFVPAPQAPRTA